MKASLLQRPDTNDFAPPERLATWKARPVRFKVAHRKNVLLAFQVATFHARSCWFGLLHPASVVALASRRPGLGKVYVCPAWIDFWNQLDDEMEVGSEDAAADVH
jgi:hypothetical protein